MIHVGDPIDVRHAKYVQHVVREDQWPAGTTFDDYLSSIVDVVTGDENGLFADHRPDGWYLTCVAWSNIWEGLDGGPIIIVVYDCQKERLVTAFQPSRGLPYAAHNDQVVDGTWLKRLR